MNYSTGTAARNNLCACHMCCKLSPSDVQHCPRCQERLHPRKTNSMQRTLALLITACVLYVPANLYPIMYSTHLGATEASTIIGGVIALIELDSAPIALVIFVFSVIVPSGKIMALFYLVWTVDRHSPLNPRQRSLMYRFTEFIGKWSMVDVFVVAILVALVHLGEIMMVRPGIAALSFAGVVIVTMVAAQSFDSRLIWDNMEEQTRDK